MTTDPAITIAGLRAERDALAYRLGVCVEAIEAAHLRAAERDRVTAERDALAAALATCTAERDEAVAANITAAVAYQEELARVEGARATAVGLASDYKTRAEQLAERVNAVASERDSALANLRACEARVAAVEAESNKAAAEAAALRLRVADLEARPVLTHALLSDAIEKGRKVPPYIARQAADEYMPHLSAVTLPAQDRAEEFLSHFFDALFPGFKERDTDKMLGKDRATQVAAVKHALASLGAAPTTPPAEVFAGVSASDLDVAYIGGQRECHWRHDGAIKDCCRYAAIAAVLARLKVKLVAPVDPVVVEGDRYNRQRRSSDAWLFLDDDVKKERIAAMRAALIAAGVPVTPERGR